MPFVERSGREGYRMRYGFVGLGNMATAIIRGVLGEELCSPEDMRGYDVNTHAAERLSERTGIWQCATLEELVLGSDMIILAVKPQGLEAVLADLKKQPLEGKVILSIAAGKDLEFLEKGLGKDVPVVRVMPNINAKVGASTSAYVANSFTSQEQKDAVKALFSAVGTAIELPESLFPVFSAVAGAAPAFCYLYIDALARAGVRGGMPREQALKVAASTVLGSARMVLESGEHPFTLIDQVTSPAGTTIEGLCALQRLGFESAVHQAIEAVVNRDKAL